MKKKIVIRFPDIGEGVVEGEVIEWRKQPGESVAQDEPVVVVMTDKATVELPSPYPGVLVTQHIPAGEIAQKDHPLYELLIAEEIAPIESKVIRPEKLQEQQTFTEERPQKGKALATPATRSLAKELGVSIDEVVGTGPGGRITPSDVASHHALEEKNVKQKNQ